MTKAEPYCYEKLTDIGAIRLIVLQPAVEPTAPLYCALISTNLCTCEYNLIDNYTALSYVWGNAAERGTIDIGGKVLDITASLELALRHIRDPLRTLHVWADGICINQTDIEEKNP